MAPTKKNMNRQKALTKSRKNTFVRSRKLKHKASVLGMEKAKKNASMIGKKAATMRKGHSTRKAVKRGALRELNANAVKAAKAELEAEKSAMNVGSTRRTSRRIANVSSAKKIADEAAKAKKLENAAAKKAAGEAKKAAAAIKKAEAAAKKLEIIREENSSYNSQLHSKKKYKSAPLHPNYVKEYPVYPEQNVMNIELANIMKKIKI